MFKKSGVGFLELLDHPFSSGDGGHVCAPRTKALNMFFSKPAIKDSKVIPAASPCLRPEAN